jgi:hypothetical protein
VCGLCGARQGHHIRERMALRRPQLRTEAVARCAASQNRKLKAGCRLRAQVESGRFFLHYFFLGAGFFFPLADGN